MRIIFSRDRAAQLDLLLRSCAAHLRSDETIVIWSASTAEHRAGYAELEFSGYNDDLGNRFNSLLRETLARSGRTVTFMCDDDVVYRTPPDDPATVLLADDELACVSLRLGRRNRFMTSPPSFPRWEWRRLPRHDYGFPASVDGHTFRVAEVLRLIGSDMIGNPTMLETVMVWRADDVLEQRPFMRAFEDQCLVGVPVNRVSPQSGCAFGAMFPQATDEMLARLLAGERIVLPDELGFVDSCHAEIAFEWEARQ